MSKQNNLKRQIPNIIGKYIELAFTLDKLLTIPINNSNKLVLI